MRALSLLAAAIWLSPATACGGSRSGPYTLELVDENGNQLPAYAHGGRTYVLGHEGQRYSLRIRNHSRQRVEFVASVDARDVLDGTPANWSKRGYIVNAWDQVLIDGFRLNHESVAAFRFGSVRDSYAARMGDAQDMGVIGVAVFTERKRGVDMESALQEGRSRDRVSAGAPSNVFGPGGLGTGLTNALDSAVDPRRREEKRPEVAASKKGAPMVAEAEDRPGLGTEFGEQRASYVTDADFDRASYSPAARLTVRYDDREGLRALGIDLELRSDEREADRRQRAQPFRANFCTPPPGWGP